MGTLNVMLRKDITSKKFNVIGYKDTMYKAFINETTKKAEINIKPNLYLIVEPKDYVICKTDNGMIEYHREPTKDEIKFGEGAIHYLNIPESVCRKQNGDLKKWVNFDNKRYYY